MLAGGILRYLERTTMNKLSYHDASIAAIVDKINELVIYVNKNGDFVKRPMVLYAVENIKTGAIIFNARGSGYQDKDAAIRKCKELGEGHRLVEYKLDNRGINKDE